MLRQPRRPPLFLPLATLALLLLVPYYILQGIDNLRILVATRFRIPTTLRSERNVCCARATAIQGSPRHDAPSPPTPTQLLPFLYGSDSSISPPAAILNNKIKNNKLSTLLKKLSTHGFWSFAKLEIKLSKFWSFNWAKNFQIRPFNWVKTF